MQLRLEKPQQGCLRLGVPAPQLSPHLSQNQGAGGTVPREGPRPEKSEVTDMCPRDQGTAAKDREGYAGHGQLSPLSAVPEARPQLLAGRILTCDLCTHPVAGSGSGPSHSPQPALSTCAIWGA